MTYAILFMISAVLGVPKSALTCESALTSLFAPPVTDLVGYEVCTTREPLIAVAKEGWQVQTLPAADAFGAAVAVDRVALTRLYGGLHPTVARGWARAGDHWESLTLISPYPNRTLTGLLPGTLLMRATITPKKAP